jgi:hypothetical protein
MLNVTLACVVLAAVEVESNEIRTWLEPASHMVSVESRFQLRGAGELRLRLTPRAKLEPITIDNEVIDDSQIRRIDGPGHVILTLQVDHPRADLRIRHTAQLHQDVAAGEREGHIHNQSVDAHVGPEGVFLSDGAAWHAQPVDADGVPLLVSTSLEVAPLAGFTMTASGDPTGAGRPTGEPVWNWRMPRPVDGVALVGKPNGRTIGRVHETAEGPVEIIAHFGEANAKHAELFIDAACKYLDLYVPLLGRFPYKRFTIVENFFSSGFAYPGFTLLGPQVIAMGERALAPGYLDHELLHNWWGNGVYVDSTSTGDGNWCEALTSYCTNYGRRLLEDGEDAAKSYRRGILMKLSTDPGALDNAPLGDFGRAAAAVEPDRFVGYEKGTFLFIMLENSFRTPDATSDRARWWRTLRRFAVANMGRRASWATIQATVEQEYGAQRGKFFGTWVRQHTVPVTGTDADSVVTDLALQIADGQDVESTSGEDARGRWIEVDPDFEIYRVLPPGQIIPTLAGTLGAGGVAMVSRSERPEVAAYRQRVESNPEGENLLLVGREAASGEQALLARVGDPIVINESSFIVGGKTYDQSTQAVLHTMQHPDRPGRFISVFITNSDAGWSRLRLINFYTRDTTIIWDGDKVIDRRVFEPERRLRYPN